ncbi:Rhomboid protease GluP [Aquisphaera giovannonii]|uniref:Rhomboid protease GluP n=1 Tax=Aquisphaera giovannonii TaxID=406548 RepID=A0A5B9VVB9_9BACT|nr:rhomboid family intramembrane serine protease [Aquisphaera giovannonii]QEH32182.1 Rhomboid protease GluP [Aquisphaera giovannonii]
MASEPDARESDVPATAIPAPARLSDDGDEDIPVIVEDMLHQERVDLEAGMSPVPRATILLIVACLVVYGRQVQVGGLANAARVIQTGATHRDEVLDGQAWRLMSGAFMHANLEHLLGNMALLYILGMACEHAFGVQPFLFLYVAACIAGGLVTMTTEVPAVGASGAIFGLAGAIISLVYVRRRRIELRDHRVGIVLAIWAVYTLALGLLSPIVSNVCLLGGLLGGLILGAILPPAILIDRRELARRPITRLQGALALGILAVSAILFVPHLR